MADYPDFEGAKSKLFTVGDWAAVEASDKNITYAHDDVVDGGSAGLAYTVPTGKTLYITSLTFAIYASGTTDREKSQIGYVWLRDDTSGINRIIIGGNGGAGINLSKPVSFTAGHQVFATVYNFSGHDCDIEVTAHGYEI